MTAMETFVLVFPMAADSGGICLIQPEPWTHGPVQAGIGVDKTVWAVLEGHGLADPEPLIVHSVSWHEIKTSGPATDGQGGLREVPIYQQVDAYLAITGLEAGYTVIEERWPAAIPVDLAAIATVGATPPKHGPARPPVEVMQAHALLHGLRHLALELGPYGDSELREALTGTAWPGHCAELLGVLAHMYRHDLTGQPAATATG